MPKRFPSTAQIERQGVALCATVVAEMGHIWREKSVSDVGIDGEIELVDLGTRSALGHSLLVQSKAKSGDFEAETEETFRFRCSPDDLDYWLNASAPVLLVCSRPRTGEAWFKNLRQWFGDDPERRRRRIIEFDKAVDRFNASAAGILLDWGVPATSGIYLQSPPRPETLMSNLLRVEHVADHVHVAPSSIQGWRDINTRLRKSGHDLVSDVVWRDKQVYSFRSFDLPPMNALADDTPERIATDELEDSKSDDDQRLLVRLLNNTLRELHPELSWDNKREYLYFPATPDLRPRKLKVRSSGSGRTVFERYLDKETKTRVTYYRHYAVRFRFLHLDGSWFVALTPTYHFTIDGTIESKYAGDYLKRIKQIEGHSAVGHLTKFWAEYFRTPPEDLFGSPDQRLRFGLLAELDFSHGIDDEAWKPRSKTAPIDGQTHFEGIE